MREGVREGVREGATASQLVHNLPQGKEQLPPESRPDKTKTQDLVKARGKRQAPPSLLLMYFRPTGREWLIDFRTRRDSVNRAVIPRMD